VDDIGPLVELVESQIERARADLPRS
jgi:hypothetical protein